MKKLAFDSMVLEACWKLLISALPSFQLKSITQSLWLVKWTKGAIVLVTLSAPEISDCDDASGLGILLS